jgi:hypothetical protein
MADYNSLNVSGSLSNYILDKVDYLDSINPDIGLLSKAIYRGFLSGQYVYQIGGIPSGATDIVIIGYTK